MDARCSRHYSPVALSLSFSLSLGTGLSSSSEDQSWQLPRSPGLSLVPARHLRPLVGHSLAGPGLAAALCLRILPVSARLSLCSELGQAGVSLHQPPSSSTASAQPLLVPVSRAHSSLSSLGDNTRGHSEDTIHTHNLRSINRDTLFLLQPPGLPWSCCHLISARFPPFSRPALGTSSQPGSLSQLIIR